MDTQEDFLFLQGHIAEKFNPLYEGEYIVIQTRTEHWRLHPLHRAFSYWQAESVCSMENMGSDHNHYSVRVIHCGKLHRVDNGGNPTETSKEQDWQVHQDYYNARYVNKEDCDIQTCYCSYPVFWSWRNVPGANAQTVRDWRAVTCLVDNHGLEVDRCPNCGLPLLVYEEDWDGEGEANEEDEWFDWEEIPDTCKGCKFFNQKSHIPCAVHPSGVEDEICPDYSSEPPF